MTRTQGHLAQHLFFHVFHGLHLDRFAPGMFGIAAAQTVMLREQGRSWIEILERGAVPVHTFRAAFRGVLEADARNGVAMHEAWPAQADRVVARTLAWTPCWMTRPAPRLDKANPEDRLVLRIRTAQPGLSGAALCPCKSWSSCSGTHSARA